VVGRAGSLKGDVRVARLVVQDGATFIGNVSMGKAALEAPPKPVEAVKPPEAVKPVAAVKPVEAVKSPEPAKPVQPIQAAKPTDRKTKPPDRKRR
jgi:cytoskeletal protein CcmA (bactofilin family)